MMQDWVLTWGPKGSRDTGPVSEVWETGSETGQGFGVVNWEQEVVTGKTGRGERIGNELRWASGIIVSGGVIGLLLGGGSGALVGLFIGLFLAPAAFRDSTPPETKNVGGFIPGLTGWGTRQPTEAERILDADPVTRWERMQAYLWEDADGEEYFFVMANEGGKGVASIRIFVPWRAVEELSKSNSRSLTSRAMPSLMPDCGIIAVHTRAGTGVVAETVHGEASLDGLYFALNDQFGPEAREKYYEEKKRHAALARGESEGSGSTIPDQL